VLGLVGLATWAAGTWGPAGRGPGAGEPPLLRLSTGYTAVAGEDRSGAPSGGRFVLDGTLPDEVPGDLPVYRLPAPDRDAGRTLAEALGFSGAGEDEGPAWVWRHGDRMLHVQNSTGGAWTLTSGMDSLCVEPVPPVASPDGTPVPDGTPGPADGTVTGCRIEPDQGEPPTAPTTTPDEALAVAGPVLDVLGLDGAPTTSGPGPVVTVAVEPTVGGLPTAGATTTVSVQGSDIVGANGWLGRPSEGPRYPVISARAAFDLLELTPMPLAEMACPEPAPGTQVEGSPLCGGQVTVTGARMGLSLQWESDRPLLVPSWLLDVKGSPLPVAQVAVHPDHLGGPEEAPLPGTDPGNGTEPGGGSAGSGGSGSSGGSVGSGGIGGGSTGIGAVEPDPGTGAPEPTSRFTAVTRGADDRSVEVTFWGGVKECFAYSVQVTETDDLVELTLQERRRGDGPCIELAQEYTLVVAFESPLGQRRLVDAQTGQTLLG